MNTANTEAATLRQPSKGTYRRQPNHGAGLLELLICIWLVMSAFAWPHSPAQLTNTWIVGVVGIVIALASIYFDDRVRYANALVAIWLFISIWALRGGRIGTFWNNLIIALVLFVLSMPTSDDQVWHAELNARRERLRGHPGARANGYHRTG
jgi:O-antigen ligase